MSVRNLSLLLVVALVFGVASAAYAGVGARVEAKQERNGQLNLYLVAWNSDWWPLEGRDCYVEVKKRTKAWNGTWTRWEKMRFTFHDGGTAKSIFRTLLGPATTTEAEMMGYGFK